MVLNISCLRIQKLKIKYDDDNYMGLSHDFFSNDLKMVKESIEAGKDDFQQVCCLT